MVVLVISYHISKKTKCQIKEFLLVNCHSKRDILETVQCSSVRFTKVTKTLPMNIFLDMIGPIPSVIRHTSNPNQCLVYLKGTKSGFPEFPEKRNSSLIGELLLEAKFRPDSPESPSSENQPDSGSLSRPDCVCCSEGKLKWYPRDRRQYLNLLVYFMRMLRSVNCFPFII